MSYLFIDDLERLRAKLKSGISPLDRWWPHFLQLAKHHSPVFSLFPALAYLGTGEIEYAALAKERIMEGVRRLPAFAYTEHVQFHIWCQIQPLSRLATAYDWVADSGLFTAEEHAEIAERFLEIAYKDSYLRAMGRIKTSDNQQMAMCFGCAVIGYLFGQKRGADPRAQEIFAYGVNRFPDLVGYSQPGGYSLEGSTYMDGVVMPSAALFAAFMEDITGEDHLSRRYPPHDTCLREALEIDAGMIGPGGLQPPWDHYGFGRAMNKCGLAYLARKTGNHAVLALVTALDMWAEGDSIAWGNDDKLWTLLWWPEEAHIPTDVNPFPSWVVPNTAASLDAPARQMRWFQYWDRSGSDYGVGRTQVNPNAVIFEAFGSPFLLDGTPTPECTEFNYPLEQVAPYMTPDRVESTLGHFKGFTSRCNTLDTWLQGWTYGCLGGSNSIIVDGESWYAPSEEKEGRAVAFAATGPLKAIASEASTYYQPRFDVTAMRRTSMLVRDAYVVTSDRITAASAHDWSWQAYARPGVREVGAGFRIETPEQTCCDIVPARAYPRASHQVPGYIWALEGAADLLQFHQSGQEASFTFCFFPSLKLEHAADLTDGWTAGVELSAANACPWQQAPQAGKAIRLDEMPYFMPEAPADAWRWAQQTFSRPAGERFYLRLEKAVMSARVWVNGQEVALALPEDILHNPDRLTPLVAEITALLHDGDNLIVMAAKPLRGKTFTGSAGLYRGVKAPAPPVIAEIAPACYTVETADGLDLLVIGADGPVHLPGWETDAWCARLDAGEGAALGATYCRGEGVAFHGTQANVAWTADAFTCGDLSGEADLWCAWAAGQVHVEAHGVIRISGSAGLQVSWTADHAKPVFVNGQPVTPIYDPLSRTFRVTLAAGARVTGDSSQARWNRAVALAVQPGEAARLELETLLDDTCWPVRSAAALSLGRRRETASVPALLAALRKDMAKESYPPIPMNTDEVAGLLAPAQPLDTAPQEQYLKRWHVAMCCAVALGQLRDRAAVPMLCELLDRQTDFYPALANAAWALGQIGDPAALPSLTPYQDYYELNARMRSREALGIITAAAAAVR